MVQSFFLNSSITDAQSLVNSFHTCASLINPLSKSLPRFPLSMDLLMVTLPDIFTEESLFKGQNDTWFRCHLNKRKNPVSLTFSSCRHVYDVEPTTFLLELIRV